MNTGIIKKGVICQLVLCLCLYFAAIGIRADEAVRLQNYIRDKEWIAYLPDRSYTDDSAEVRIGNSALLEGTLQPVGVSGQIQTLILVDNSMSIAAGNREKMKSVVRRIIEDGTGSEQFALACFDTEIHMLSEMTGEKEILLQILEEIRFQDQETYLKRCLYETIGNPAVFSEDSFARIIVCSDGSEDDPAGFSEEEIVRRLRDNPCQLIAVGSLYERNPEALGKLFALSRSGNNGCYLLDDCGDDISGIADGILREKPGYTVSVSLEDRLMDGSEKQVQVTAETADGTFCGVASVVMPFSEIILSEEEDLNSEDLDSEDQDSSMEENPDETADPDVPEGQETLRDEPEGLPGPEEGIQEPEGTEELQETYETGSAGETDGAENQEIAVRAGDFRSWRTWLLLISAILIPVGSLAAFFLLHGRRKEQNSPGDGRDFFQEEDPAVPESPETDSEEKYTVYGFPEEDDSTVLMHINPAGDLSAGPGSVSLVSEEDPGMRFSFRPDHAVVIGRFPDCGIVLKGDRSVSGHHCVIYPADGELMIRDNGSSNGTWLNHRKVDLPEKVASGDIITIGRGSWILKEGYKQDDR